VTGTPRLEARGLTKGFPGVLAVDSADLSVMPGEIHALAGENGSGKSTLCMLLTGVHRPDAGEIQVDGKTVMPESPRHAQQLGISMMYQESNLVPELTVTDNVALGHGAFVRSRRRQRQAVRLILERLGFQIDPGAKAASLSGAKMQMVEIAKALYTRSRLIIMDEPTAALGAAEAERLHAVIRELAASGVSIIYISHALEEALQLAHRVTVLRDGQVVASHATAELTRDRLVHLMVGRHVGIVERQLPSGRHGQEALRAEKLSWRDKVLDASLVLRRGEVVGLAGLVGSGRSELAGLLAGLARPAEGRIFLHGQQVSLRGPADARRHGVVMLTENRKEDGLFLHLSVKINLTIGILHRLRSRIGLLRGKREGMLAAELVKRLGVVTSSLAVPARNLSGGNQQKMLFGRLLAREPEVLILDEPTKGVDVGAIEEIHRIVRQLADEGRAILVISSYLPEVMALADRIYVMRSGSIVAEVTADEASAAQIVSQAFH